MTEVLRSGPGWESYFLPVVLVMSVAAIQPIVNFMRPEWVGFRSAVRILTDLALIVIFALSLNTGHWIVPTDPSGVVSEKARALADAVNPWVGISLSVALVITAGMLLLEVRRLAVRRRSRPERGSPAGG